MNLSQSLGLFDTPESAKAEQEREVALWERHVEYLGAVLEKESHADEAEQLGIRDRLEQAREQLEWARGEDYLHSLQGTLGADPLRPAEAGSETGGRRCAAGGLIRRQLPALPLQRGCG